MLYLLFFFFFQAEDGIRDKLVTGVQTCALPIYGDGNARRESHGGWLGQSLLQPRSRARPPRYAVSRGGFRAAVAAHSGGQRALVGDRRSPSLRAACSARGRARQADTRV